jgi:hypothetical protein
MPMNSTDWTLAGDPDEDGPAAWSEWAITILAAEAATIVKTVFIFIWFLLFLNQLGDKVSGSCSYLYFVAAMNGQPKKKCCYEPTVLMLKACYGNDKFAAHVKKITGAGLNLLQTVSSKPRSE